MGRQVLLLLLRRTWEMVSVDRERRVRVRLEVVRLRWMRLVMLLVAILLVLVLMGVRLLVLSMRLLARRVVDQAWEGLRVAWVGERQVVERRRLMRESAVDAVVVWVGWSVLARTSDARISVEREGGRRPGR